MARLRFVTRAKLLGLTLEETRKLVGLAAGCNRGEIVPDLEEILQEKLQETERRMEEASFCGCVDAVTYPATEDRRCSSAPT